MTHLANIFRIKSSETSSFDKQLRQATSNKDATPSNKVLMEISDHSNNYKELDKIMKRTWRVLDAGDKRKWRKISKTLNLVDHLLKNGSFQCVEEFRDKKEKLMSFQKFYYFEGGQDRGFAIRQQSDKIVALLNNRDVLVEQRDLAQQLSENQQGTGLRLTQSASLKPSSNIQNKENENTTAVSKPSKPKETTNVNNPFKTIPAPPENPLSSNRSKSNPVTVVDLLGLETPATIVVNEKENKNVPQNNNNRIDKLQPNLVNLIDENIANLLQKKDTSESEEDEAHSHSHSDFDIEDQEFESIGYSHLNSKHQKNRDTQIKNILDIDLMDPEVQNPTMAEGQQHSPPISSNYSQNILNITQYNPLIQANIIAEQQAAKRKTSLNNPFRSDYASQNSNFNNPFRSTNTPLDATKSNTNGNNNVNENINPNIANLNMRKTVSMQNNTGKPLVQNNIQRQEQAPICASSEDLDHLALEFASKTPTKSNLLRNGGGESHEEHDDIYLSNPALVSRVSCPENIGIQKNFNNPFNANYSGIKPCKNNPFAPKLL